MWSASIEWEETECPECRPDPALAEAINVGPPMPERKEALKRVHLGNAGMLIIALE